MMVELMQLVMLLLWLFIVNLNWWWYRFCGGLDNLFGMLLNWSWLMNGRLFRIDGSVWNGNLCHWTIFREYWMANQSCDFAWNNQHQYGSTCFQYIDGMIMIGFNNRNAIHFENFIANLQSSQIGWSTFGYSWYENAFIVAFVWRWTFTTGNAQTQTSRCPFNVDFIVFGS